MLCAWLVVFASSINTRGQATVDAEGSTEVERKYYRDDMQRATFVVDDAARLDQATYGTEEAAGSPGRPGEGAQAGASGQAADVDASSFAELDSVLAVAADPKTEAYKLNDEQKVAARDVLEALMPSDSNPSDHAYVMAKLQVGEVEVEVLQWNVLAQGLAADGFGKRPTKKEDIGTLDIESYINFIEAMRTGRHTKAFNAVEDKKNHNDVWKALFPDAAAKVTWSKDANATNEGFKNWLKDTPKYRGLVSTNHDKKQRMTQFKVAFEDLRDKGKTPDVITFNEFDIAAEMYIVLEEVWPGIFGFTGDNGSTSSDRELATATGVSKPMGLLLEFDKDKKKKEARRSEWLDLLKENVAEKRAWAPGFMSNARAFNTADNAVSAEDSNAIFFNKRKFELHSVQFQVGTGGYDAALRARLKPRGQVCRAKDGLDGLQEENAKKLCPKLTAKDCLNSENMCEPIVSDTCSPSDTCFDVITAHLSSGADKEYKRVKELRGVLAVNDCTEEANKEFGCGLVDEAYPTILAGDLNSDVYFHRYKENKKHLEKAEGNTCYKLLKEREFNTVWDSDADSDSGDPLPMTAVKLRGPTGKQPAKFGLLAVEGIDYIAFRKGSTGSPDINFKTTANGKHYMIGPEDPKLIPFHKRELLKSLE